MNLIKKLLGICWMIIGPAAMGFIIYEASRKIEEHPGDQSVYLPWIIIITIFFPITIGFVLFGYYAFRGEYAITKENSGV